MKKIGITLKNINDHFVEVHVATATQDKMIKNTNEFLTNFIEFLKNERIESGCYICGSNIVENYEFGEDYCANCANKIQNENEEAKNEKANQKSNIFLGIVGALIGSLIGVLFWVFIYKLRIHSRHYRFYYSILFDERL